MTPFRKELLLLINYAEQILIQYDINSTLNEADKDHIRQRKEHLLGNVWPSLEDTTNIAAIDLLFSFQQFIATTMKFNETFDLSDLQGNTEQMTVESFLRSIDELITSVESIIT